MCWRNIFRSLGRRQRAFSQDVSSYYSNICASSTSSYESSDMGSTSPNEPRRQNRPENRRNNRIYNGLRDEYTRRKFDTKPEPEIEARKLYKSTLLHFEFLGGTNNTIPWRITEEDGTPISMYDFQREISHAAMILLSSHGWSRVPRTGKTGRYMRAVIESYSEVKIRWDLGCGLHGDMQLPVVDSEVTWKEAVKLLGNSGGRHSVVVTLPQEKLECLMDAMQSADELSWEPVEESVTWGSLVPDFTGKTLASEMTEEWVRNHGRWAI